MLKYLHTLSAILFYALGSSFFLAYILLHNDILMTPATQWLSMGDMPLLLSGVLYGGLSVYLSVKNDKESSTVLMLGIGVPLGMLFLLFLILNFL